MARPGREEENSLSSRRTPTPSKRNGTAISKTRSAIGNKAVVASNTNPKHGNAEKPTSNPRSTPAINLEDSDNDENEGRNNTEEPKVAFGSGLSATPVDDLYTPLLMFICEHSFMREKRYPVSRSVRARFVRDVRAEARVLGFGRPIVDRVLLDIKRYYLTKVGQYHVFDDGATFGEEVDDSSSSEGLDVKTKPSKPQEKRKRKRNSGEEPAKKTSQTPVKATQGKTKGAPALKKGEKETKLQSRPRKKKRSSKASSNTNALKGEANDLSGLTAGDEVRSKYFVNSQVSKPVDVEVSCKSPNGHSVPDDVLGLLEDMGLASDLLLSDSTLSDVPSDLEDSPTPSPAPLTSPKLGDADDDLGGIADASIGPVKSSHFAVGVREQTPPQLDFSLNPTLIPEKKPRSKPTKVSPYFQGPLLNKESCLPFPPIDEPAFGLVQEQLAHDPFRLLLATIFLNRTRGGVALPILFQVFNRYPTIEAMAAADPSELTAMINRLGFQNQRARKCISLAQTWLNYPPCRGKRYRKLNYPRKTDGRDVKPNECIDDDDPRVAWEVAHLPGVGAYALDSWRIFCRDELRGLPTDWQGTGAATAGFTPEWKSVLPQDKELRAYLTWMWLKEGWVWDRETGERTPANEKVMRAARRGATAHIEAGNWVLETSPVKRR